MSKVLIIEDDRDIAELVEFNLKEEHFHVEVCDNGKSGLQRVKETIPDLVVLDLMLPDLGGLEICKAMKQDPKTKNTPVLILTAKGSEVDRVVGLELGADDYLTKPFSPRELALRVKAILKRTHAEKTPSKGPLHFGVLTLDSERFEVKVEGEEIQLTALEFRLLKFLFENKGRVATRDILLDRVWGYDAELNTRTVDTHIKRLREKLKAAGDYIETIRGMGYRFREKQTIG